MKNKFLNILLVMATLCATFTSCSSSNDDSIEAVSFYQLVGKWTLQSANGEEYGSGRQYMVINMDNTYEVFPKGNPFGIPDKGTIQFKDSKVTLSNKATFTIVKLTKTLLVLKGDNQLTLTFTREASDYLDIDYASVAKLVGKWEQRTYRFEHEVIGTYNSSNRYLQLNADFTFVSNPRTLLEAEILGGTWALKDNGQTLIFNNNENYSYRILKLTATELELGWIYEGSIIEWSTFEKVQ